MRVAPSDTGVDVVVVRGFASDGTRVGPSDLLVSLRGREARARASLRKEVTGDGNVRWVRLAGSGDGERGGGDARRDSVAVRRDSTRSRPPNRTRLNRPPTDPETNRQRALNARVSKAPDAVTALREFVEAHQTFPNGVNDVNVAALFVALARSARLRSRKANREKTSEDVFDADVDEETTLARAALASLLARLRELAPTTTGRVCANVLHALGQLEARDWWTRVADRGGDAIVFEDAASSVARRASVAEIAHSMNAQELANTYNGVSRLGAFAAASVTYQGWVTLSDALVTRIRASESDEGVDECARRFRGARAVLALNALASDKHARRRRGDIARRVRRAHSRRGAREACWRSWRACGGHALRAGSRERPERVRQAGKGETRRRAPRQHRGRVARVAFLHVSRRVARAACRRPGTERRAARADAVWG